MKTALKILLLAMGLMPVASFAEAPKYIAAISYEEGKDYTVITNTVAPANKARVTVEEFFWYGCPHCYHADPMIEAWNAKKPAYVDFVRVPNTLGRPIGELHARAFYTAEALKISSKMHKPLFAAIHEFKKPMATDAEVRDLFQKVAGVKPAVYDKTASSMYVTSRLRWSDQQATRYQINSVPSIVIGGKYLTSPSMLADMNKLPNVMNFLIEKARKERK